MANRTQIQNALQKPYDRILFGKEILSPVFGSSFSLSSSIVPAAVQPNKSEQAVIGSVSIYGNINLEDGTEITCYEIILQPTVRIEQSRVAIQRYIRKLLTAGQIALVNFISPQNKNVWRLTLVAKDSEITEEGIKEKTTHAKRYTYLLGPSETCKTAAERFESLSIERKITFEALVNAFSVEKLSDAFFDEYTLHYQKFCDYLQESNFRKSVFKISFPANATKEEKDKACKPIRDFVKKLLGRIVFLYFVQKKRWLGASDTNYKDGLTDFIKQLFKQSGGNDAFYSTWLTVLFFETLNKDRANDDFKMPDGKKVKVPFLNGGLFDKEDHDEHILTFKSKLFHNPDFEDTILTEKNLDYSRGFLDFLNAFNFTVHEDGPDDHIVAVDPEMLGHIFENLLEDNKDKGAFYTPKEIVHYMCQESLTEYLTTHLSKEYTVYKEIGNAQVELFGNETKQGQLKIVEQMGDKALNRDDVAYIVKYKDISKLTKQQLKKIDNLLDTVKICDPAIGSGAFPMGLLQEIFSIKEVIAFELGLNWKPAEIKENIIQNSIYGVDIEKGAVDIARLRFWLSLIVDEEKPRSLPNLDYKIVVGDSLLSKFEGEIIEIDWERKSGVGKAKEYIENIQLLLKQIAEKQKTFFKPNNKNKKKEQAEIRSLKLELLINQLSFNKEKFQSNYTQKGGFAPTTSDLKYNEQLKERRKEFDRNILKLQSLKKNKNDSFDHFDWKLDFPEILNPYLVNQNQGFDIVIGNPPYVSFYSRQAVKVDEKYLEELKKKSDFIQNKDKKGRFHTVQFFLDREKKLLKPDGIMYNIIDLSFFETAFTEIRGFVLKETEIREIIANLNVFENVASGQLILGLKNRKPDINHLVIWRDNFNESSILIQQNNWLNDGSYSITVPKSDLLNTIEYDCKSLIMFCEVKVGVNIGGVKEYFMKSDPAYYPFINGSNNVQLYQIIFPSDKQLKDGLMYFDFNKTIEKKIWDKRIGTPSIGESNERFLQPKIIIRQSDTRLTATYDDEGFHCDYNLFTANKLSDSNLELKFILAIINSRLMTYYVLEKGYLNIKPGKTPQIRVTDVKELPIKTYPNQVVFVRLVDYILFLKRKELKDNRIDSMSSYFQRIVDAAVYELYFQQSIKSSGANVLEYLSDLPILTDKNDKGSIEKDYNIIQQLYKHLTNTSHPIDSALLKLNNIEEIKIIEGKQ